MELQKIEQLINKYFQGETTISEENELKNYFSSNAVAPHLQDYQSIFGYFTNAQNEKFTKPILLKTKKQNSYMWLSVAATVIIMLGVGTFMYLNNQNANAFKGCNDHDNPELVLKETQKALNLVSKHINTGIESVEYINEYENSKSLIFKKK